MKTIPTPSLADIELELPLRRVTDDLAAFTERLSLSAGAEKGYASFTAETHPVGEITERSIGHAVEITRFLALAGTSGRTQVAYFFDMLIALLLLNHAAMIAVALAPPRLPRDVAARRRVLSDIITAAGSDAGFIAAHERHSRMATSANPPRSKPCFTRRTCPRSTTRVMVARPHSAWNKGSA